MSLSPTKSTTLFTKNDSHGKNEYNTPDSINEDIKVIEAKTAIILLNDNIYSSNQYIQWRLSIMFNTFYKNEKNKSMQILYISSDLKHPWLSSDDILPYWDRKKGLDIIYQKENNAKVEKYMITPKTNVISFMNETRLVYILDLSLSSATVGNTQSKILLSSVFNTLINSLKCIIQPFNLDQHVLIKPIIRISVLVDCSPFASNINVIPMLFNHPTIRVFLQNQILTPTNIDLIIDDLYKQFFSLQNELNHFLKQLQKKRRKMGYDLDVRFEEEMATKQSNNGKNDSHIKSDNDQLTDNENRNKTSSVWGIGKTGANLSRILQVGVLAFDLLPNFGRSQLIFITDGSLQLSSMGNQSSLNNQSNQPHHSHLPRSHSHQYQEDIIIGYLKQFSEKDIQFHVILISLTVNFIPGRNFGFLPDIDLLKYIAHSTGGSVTNADQYDYIPNINQSDYVNNTEKVDEDSYYDSEDALLLRSKHHHNQYRRYRHQHNSKNCIKLTNTIIYNHSPTITYPPNICHKRFILRESHLERTRYFEHPFSKISNNHTWQYNFPWDPDSIAPSIDSKLLKYREYPILDNISMIIAARARDGFQLQSVFFINKKKTHIQLTFVLRWQCHIFIEYRIRSNWIIESSLGFFERLISPEAEIYIRCDAEFAHMLQNWNLLKKRVQMISKQRVKDQNKKTPYFTPPASTSPTVLPMYTKVEKILTFLYQIFDSDEGLNQYTLQLKVESDISILKDKFSLYWNQQQEISDSFNHNNSNDGTSNSFVDAAKFDQNKNTYNYPIRPHYSNWYDFDTIDLLIGNISPYMAPNLASDYNQSFPKQLQGQLNDKLIEIIQLIDEKWADFYYQENGGKIGFVKLIKSLSSFCEVRLHHIYGRCISLRLCYFNAYQNNQQCQKLKSDLLSILQNEQYITICSRPLPLLLLRDKSHFIYSNENIILKYKNNNPSIFLSSSSCKQNLSSNFNLWYLSLNRSFIGKYIVHDYLNHMLWIWPVNQDSYFQQHHMMPISDVIFQNLCQARLDSGYHLIFSIPNHTHFYKESDKGFSIQYLIHKTYQGIRTELWVEPYSCFYRIRQGIIEMDQGIISQLITFDQLHNIGRTNNNELIKSLFLPLNNMEQEIENENENEHIKTVLLSQLFDISTVVIDSPFALTSFSYPSFREMLDNINNISLSFNFQSNHFGVNELLNNSAKKQLPRLTLSNQYIVFLHYYFDIGVNEIANNTINMVNQSNHEFWKSLISETNQNIFSSLHDLNQTRCFISIIDPRSFYLIIIPDLNSFISYLYNNNGTLKKNYSKFIEDANQELCFYLIKCTRQKPMALKSIPSINAINKYEVYDSTLYLHHRLFDSSQQLSLFHPKYCFSNGLINNTNNSKASMESSRKQNSAIDMIKIITKVYAESYLKSIYTLLLLSQPSLENAVTQENIMNVISLCSEITINVDITKFVFIFALLNRQNDSLLLERDQHVLNKKWKSIVSKSFVPVKLNNNNNLLKEKEQKKIVHYYQPFNHMNPYLKSKSSTNQSENKIDFNKVIQYCQYPLFVQFYCTKDEDSIPITVLSESIKEMAKKININCSIDKNEYLNSIFEHDYKHSTQDKGKMALSLVYLTIPSSKLNKKEDEIVEPSPPSLNSSIISSHPTLQPHLYQKETISLMTKQLQLLFTEQTLYLLLIFYKSHPSMVIPLSILKYLESIISTANHIHQVKYFTFVKHPKKCLHIFMDQLELQPNIKRHNNYFYSYEQDYWLLLIVNKYQVEMYCYFINTDYEPMLSSNEMTTTIYKKIIDILSKVEKKTNQVILLYSLNVTRVCSKYLETISMDNQSNRKVTENSEDVTESYSSNNTSSSNDDNDVDETGSEDDESRLENFKFVPNQFQCPMAYQKKFPLHWRIPLGKALNHLKSEVLRPFMVRNRPDMYVIEKDNNIVYFKLYETSTTKSDNLSVNTSILRQQKQNSDQLEDNGKKLSSATSSLNNHTSNELVLDVFGLECPDWICNDFVQLLDNRLYSEITLNELQTFFSRNPSSKPSLEDVQFLLPFEKKQKFHKRQPLEIPKLVNNPVKFLKYFKKSILNCNVIKPFHGINVITEVQKYQQYWFYHMENAEIKVNSEKKERKQLNKGNDDSDNDSDDSIYGDELSKSSDDGNSGLEKDDLCFYYNLNKRIPSKSNSRFELNGGQGMAGICMSITTSQKKITNKFSSSPFQFDPPLIKQNLKKYCHPTNMTYHTEVNNDNVDYMLWIDIWIVGSVEDVVLMDYFYHIFRQSLCDYFIEQTVSIDLGAILLSNTNLLQSIDTHIHTHRQMSTIIRKKFTDIILYMLNLSLTWKNPIVNEMSKSIPINPWNMKEIIHYIDRQLVQIHPSFEPTVTWKKVSPNFDLTTNTKYSNDENEDDSSDWLLYRGKPIYCRNNVQQNVKMVVISGLNEFVEQFGGGGLHHSSVFNYADDNILTTVTTNSSNPFFQPHYHYLLQENELLDSRRSSIDTTKSYRENSRRTSSGSRDTNISTNTSHIHANLPRSYSSSTSNSNFKTNDINKQQQNHHPPPLISNTIITNDISDLIVTPQLDCEKHCFFIMIMDIHHVTMYAYNWSLSSCQPLFNKIMNMIYRQQLRCDVLNNILQQKMGLFHHTIKMKDIATNYINNLNDLEESHFTAANNNEIVTTLSNISVANNNITHTKDQPTAPSQSNIRKKSMITFEQKATNRKKENSTNSNDDNSKRKYNKKRVGSGGKFMITDLNIRDVIMLPIDESEENEALSVSANTPITTHISSRLSMLQQYELNFVLMDLITTSIFDNYRFLSTAVTSNYYYFYTLLREDDLLRRHGYAFIKTYIRQSNLKNFHKKALYIYSKWCRKYGESSFLINNIQHHYYQKHENSNDKNTDLVDGNEKLTRYEVGEILRKARLLHFCRSPLFFGNHHHEQNHLPLSYCSIPSSSNQLITPTSSNSVNLGDDNNEMVKLWYKNLLSSFVTEYTTYLQKLNMQPIEFASQDYESSQDHIHYLIDENTWIKTNSTMTTVSSNASIYSNSDNNSKSQKEDRKCNSESENNDQNEENGFYYSTINIGHNVSLDYPVVLLLKVFDGGSMICEIRFTRHCFVSVTLYALHRHYGRMGYNRYQREDNETKRLILKKFEENVSHFRHSIHINSFVYDFHLYYIQHIILKMNNNLNATTKSELTDESNRNFTDSVSLLKVLHHFSSFYKTPVRFSTNRLFHGIYEFKYGKTLTNEEFFQYLYSQYRKLGFSIVTENKNNVGISFTTSEISFYQNNDIDEDISLKSTTYENSYWKHTLILSPISSQLPYKEENEEKEGDCIYIRYFIISVYQPQKSPFNMVKNIWKSNVAPNINELVANCRKSIDQIVAYILQYHQHKTNWEAIYECTQDNHNEDLKKLQLLKEFPTVKLSTLDVNIHRLLELNTIDWHEFIKIFSQIQKQSSGKIITLLEDTCYQHILFYPLSSSKDNNDKELNMNFLIHLKIHLIKKYYNEPMIDTYLIRREFSLDKFQSIQEKAYLESFGQTLCYLLWKKCYS